MRSKFLWALMLSWVAILMASLSWDWDQTDHFIMGLAQKEAESHFEKDLLFRRWVSSHGGVYVPPTTTTPPNPYLAFLPERDITTTSGLALTLINPAYMTRQVYELAADQNGVLGHITSLKPIRPENQPDEWERKALLAFEQGSKEQSSLETLNGKPYLRLMHPLYTEASCLKCHGYQAYKIGDVRGGISVAVPFGPYQKIADAQHRIQSMVYLGMALLGLVGIWLGGRTLKRAENLLRNSLKEAEHLAAQNNLLLSSLAEGVYGVDKAGKCIFMNPSALAMLDLAELDVIGQDQHSLFHSRKPDGSPFPHHECPVYLTLQDGQKREGEDAFLRRNGQSFPVRLAATPLKEGSTIVGAVVAFQDISTQKFLEEQQRSAALYARSLIEASLDPLVTINKEGKITDVNASTEQVTGYSRNTLIGSDFSTYFTDPEKARNGYQEVYEKGRVIDYPLAIRHRDGHITEVLYNASLYHKQDGEVEGVFAAARDITERKRLEVELTHQAHSDYLTGTHNRRYFMELAEQEMRRTIRYASPLSLMMMDIDFFKQINDSHGHKAGDLVLQKLADVCLKALREVDIIGRLGGEEFAILLPQTDLEEAHRVAERLRQALADTKVPLDEGLPLRLTVSIGITALISKEENLDVLLCRADKALYEAKESGRNRVCIAMQ